ncbi:methylamine utilization protein MauJ [Burkholderia cenocepacia]|uniref:methylamine utilization protein MauJ n=1 Tax=Burkholderia cenocepacia TaxID=95486 RepID=UPI00158F523A|nr:methylamine utilization protein MauJ [Burkholderia cenocepacia]
MRNVTLGESLGMVLQGGERGFSCNHMPVIEDDNVRKALAFLREGRRLERVHEPYSFLSFFKVIESQFRPRDRVAWVEENLTLITQERAVKRINELLGQGVNVNQHLFDSGRCAVAHASVDGNIVDPDIPADRRRITADLDIISCLADRYIKIDAGVPDEMDLYKSRNRVAPWYALMPTESVAVLEAGGRLASEEAFGQLNGATVSVRLWPDIPAPQFEKMTLLPTESANGSAKFIALSARGTIVLAFAMDVANGRMHTLLNEGGIRAGIEILEEDIADYTRYFHSVVGNRIVELTIDGVEPVDCEVVIPVNIIPQAPEEAVAHALAQFRRARQQGA